MVGNVRTWTEDRWNDNYKGAPTEGSPWTSGNWNMRVVRGGSWCNDPDNLRSATRYKASSDSDFRVDNLGFRVARTLAP